MPVMRYCWWHAIAVLSVVAHGLPRGRTNACSSLRAKFDAELSFDFGNVVGEVESSRLTPLSLMREMHCYEMSWHFRLRHRDAGDLVTSHDQADLSARSASG